MNVLLKSLNKEMHSKALFFAVPFHAYEKFMISKSTPV